MANRIGLITKWSVEMFDEAYVANARSSVLDANKGLLTFVGAKTVKFPKWNGSGLYNYNRANHMVDGRYLGNETGDTDAEGVVKGYGFQQGDTNLIWEERTMKVDRGVQYRIDAADNEETQEKAVAFATGQINKQKIIPEIDAYCFSQIVYEGCSEAMGNLVAESASPTDDANFKPLQYIDDAVMFLEENEVDANDIIGFISPLFKRAMKRTPEVTRVMRPEDFNKAINFEIVEYSDVRFITVPTRRFYTHIDLGPGYFAPTADSKRIDLLMVAKSAVYHVVKYNKVRVFAPEVVQDYDGYKVNARIYHDVFVPDNKKVACYAVIEGRDDTMKLTAAANKVVVRTVAGEAANSFIVDSITTIPGSLLWNSLYYVAGNSAPAVGDKVSEVSGAVAIELYQEVIEETARLAYFFVADADGKITAVSPEIELKKKAAVTGD